MANSFKFRGANDVTGATTIYTVPANYTALIVGMKVANDAGADTTVTVTVTDSSAVATYKVLSSAPLPAASCMDVFSFNNRQALETGDSIAVSAAAAVDVVLSIMEMPN